MKAYLTLLFTPVLFALSCQQSSHDGVQLIANAVDESAGNVPCYKVVTPAATYFLEKEGVGLSSIVDRDGIDWIGFHKEPGSGAAGEYRGFPNSVHKQDGSFFHPRNSGTELSTTKVEYIGNDRVTISAESNNKNWGCTWDFYPTHCTFTMLKMAPDRQYWILYEGTPGGQYDDSDWWMTSARPEKTNLTTTHEGDIPAPEWIAFGDSLQKRVIFLYHHEDDDKPDRFYQMQKKMTVFGFGRDKEGKHIVQVPQTFSIGFIESTEHREISESLLRMF